MAQRQTADHEEAHAAGDRDVHRRRVGEALVDLGEVVGAQADAGVVDLDQHAAVRQRVAGDPDAGLRAGERGGVLQQLGEQVDEVVDDAAGDLGGRHGGEFDALVLLHLGGGGAEHVDQRDGAGPAAARVLTGEDEEVFAVAAHAGREVVELEEVGQLVRVRLAALQLGDERQLALDEALAAAREVGEHRVDVSAQEGLLGGEADGLAVHHVEGVRHVADLVGGVDGDRFDRGVDVVRVALGERLDQLGQTALGDVLGRGLQTGQRAHHRAGDQTGATEGDEQHQGDRGTDDQGVRVGLGLQVLGLAVEVLDELGLDPALGADLGAGLLVPVLVGDRLGLVDAALGEDRLRVAVGVGDDAVVAQLAAQVVQVVRGVDVVEARDRVVVRQAQADTEGLVARAEVGGLGVGERGADQGPLLRGRVLGERELLQRAGGDDQVLVVRGERDVLGDGQQVADDHVVGGDRRLDVLVVLVRQAAGVRDRVQVLADLQQQRLSAGEFEVLEPVGGRGEGAAQVVGGLAGRDDVVVQLGVRLVRDRAGADVALGLQRVREAGRLLGQVGQVGHLGQLLRVLHRGLDAQATEDQRDHDGEGEQGDQTGADAPVAHREPVQTGGPAPGQGGPEFVPGGLPLLAVVLLSLCIRDSATPGYPRRRYPF